MSVSRFTSGRAEPSTARSSYTAFFYTGFAGLGVVLVFFYVPEMKGRSAHEIDRMFDLRLSARKFKGWSDDESERLTG